MNRDAITALAELARIADEIDDLTNQRQALMMAARQHGAGPTAIAAATGLSRSMADRMTRRADLKR